MVAIYSEDGTAAALGASSLKNEESFDMDIDNFNRFDFCGQFSIGAQVPLGL